MEALISIVVFILIVGIRMIIRQASRSIVNDVVETSIDSKRKVKVDIEIRREKYIEESLKNSRKLKEMLSVWKYTSEWEASCREAADKIFQSALDNISSNIKSKNQVEQSTLENNLRREEAKHKWLRKGILDRFSEEYDKGNKTTKILLRDDLLEQLLQEVPHLQLYFQDENLPLKYHGIPIKLVSSKSLQENFRLEVEPSK